MFTTMKLLMRPLFGFEQRQGFGQTLICLARDQQWLKALTIDTATNLYAE